jgi:hypothetical protein
LKSHWPPTHIRSALGGITWLHGAQARPQWFASVFVLKQPPPQQVVPAPQAPGCVPQLHCPAMQVVVPPPQPPPQRPQFVKLVLVSTQVPPQHVWPVAQAAPAPQRHAPLAHESARVRSHATPH